jgi:stage II sporulation protein D
MEMLRKGLRSGGRRSATVSRVGGRVARAGAVSLLILAGFVASLLAARPSHGTTATTTSTASTTTVSTAASVLLITGHGWGHGLGMSQWGAYGYAQHGFTYNRILAHYYPKTTLAHAPGRTLRVLVAQAKTVTLGSTGGWSAIDATGRRVPLDPGSVDLGAALTLASHPELSPPFSFTSPTPLTVNGHAYRGKLVVSSDGKLVSVIDYVGLEPYLDGVVPAEMPSNWATAALEAQAVAARSYALANLVKSGPFDLYGDSRSQVYGGVAVESAATNSAVDATSGMVVQYNGQVADTLFHSSSGGRTVSSLEATGVAVPYLVSVSDPYDSLSPLHDWGPLLVDATKVQKELKLTSAITGLTATDGASGRVKSLDVATDDDTSASFTGNEVRFALGLYSTWFQPVLLGLRSSARTVAYGGAATLLGTADGATGVTLEAKPAGTLNWVSAGSPVPAPDGSFTLSVKPRLATSYRLAYGSARVGLATVAVAARVTAAVSSSGIAGTAQPAAAGAQVQLLQRSNGAWVVASSTVTDAAGSFGFGGSPAAGTYRVRVTPGHGIAPGLSAPLAVP